MKFSKNLKFTILLPAAVLVIGLIVGIICGGMNLGIDFTGGTMMTIAMHQDFDSSVVTKAFVDEGFSEKDISLTVSGSGEEAEALVRFPDTNDADRENEIRRRRRKDHPGDLSQRGGRIHRSRRRRCGP